MAVVPSAMQGPDNMERHGTSLERFPQRPADRGAQAPARWAKYSRTRRVLVS